MIELLFEPQTKFGALVDYIFIIIWLYIICSKIDKISDRIDRINKE